LGSVHRCSGDVRARPIQAFDYTYADRIKNRQHHDGDRFARFCGGHGSRHVRRKDHIDLPIDQVGHHALIFCVQDGLVVFDADVLLFNITKLRQPVLEDFKSLRIGIFGRHIAHDRQRLSSSVGNLNHCQQHRPEHCSTPK
jgi:hypothetical protein